jgi:limonene-1,2-epoxide hydrolase
MTSDRGAPDARDPVAVTRDAVHAWIRAVESGDVERVLETLAPDCSYRNVPEEPAVGRDAIRGLFARVLERSDRIVFDVISESYVAGHGFAERLDRFWIDGAEHVLACNGVFEVDLETGLITEVRDYLDLTGWRQQMVAAGL